MTYIRHFLFYMTLALNGCIRLPMVDNTTKQVDFNRLSQVSKTKTPKSFGLKVLIPTTLPSLNSGRICFYQTDKNMLTMTHVAEIIWKDPLPLLVQQHNVESLLHSNLFHVVGEIKDKFNASYTLQTHLNHFEVVQQATSSYARLEITHILSSTFDKQGIYQKNFKIHMPLTDLTKQTIIYAFDKAFQNYQHQLMTWIDQKI